MLDKVFMCRSGFVLSALICGSALHAQVEVRVRNTAGGPRLFVNGKVRAPRFLYAPPANRPVDVGMDWQSYELDFEPTIAADLAALQFRFEKKAGVVGLRNVRVLDPDGKEVGLGDSFSGLDLFRKRWGVNLEDEYGKIAFADNALKVTVFEPKRWHADFHLYSHPFRIAFRKRYRVSFEACGDREMQVLPAVYLVRPERSYAFSPFIGRDVMTEQIRVAALSGVDLVTFPVPCAWYETGYDWSEMDALIRRAIAANPKMLFVPRFGVDAPYWYLKKHPNARVRFSDGQEKMNVSIADPTYRNAACDYTEHATRHLQSAFPDNFAGLHVCALCTGEWAYQNRAGGVLSGFDVATRDAYRRWLAQRGDPDAACAEIPSVEERRAGAEHGFFLRDPKRNRTALDFARFRQENLISFMDELGAALRRGSSGKSLSVFFYGYTWELSDRECGPGETGHFALAELLRNYKANFDILCAPYSYTNRKWPGSSPVMSPAESVTRAGVMWLTENDTRTYLERAWDSMALNASGGHRITKQETKQVLCRSTAFDMIHGYGCWWMDLLGRGWYADSDLWDELKRLEPLEKAMLLRKNVYSPELAAIADEQGLLELVPGANSVMTPLTSRYPFDQCGVPYGQYLLDDVLKSQVSARMQVFTMAFHLTAWQREALKRQRIERPDLMRVWCWAPGWLNENGACDANVEDVTSFRVRRVDVPYRAKVTTTEDGRSAGLRASWGCAMPAKIRPCFGVETRPDDEVWARYEGDGSAAMVVRKCGSGGYEVFLGTAHFLPEALAALAHMAGVHVYAAPATCNVCSSEEVVALQALEDGPLAIDFGANGKVYDLLTGRYVGKGPRIDVPFRKGELKVFQLR